MLESGLLEDAGDRYELSGPLPPLAIPSTLHDSLLARLDRLAPVKEVAQIGAAIGREFSHALLAAVADRPEARAAGRARPAGRVRAGLPPRHAARGDLQLQARAGPGRRLRHACSSPAASSSTPASPQVLEEQFPETVEAQPELLAHHCTEAGLVEQGGRLLAQGRTAGDPALGQWRRRSRTLDKGLELLAGLAGRRRARPPGARAAGCAGRGADRRARARRRRRQARPTPEPASCAEQLGDSRRLCSGAVRTVDFHHSSRAELRAAREARRRAAQR